MGYGGCKQPDQDYWWRGCYGTPSKGFSWAAQGIQKAKEQAAAQQSQQASETTPEPTAPEPEPEG
jgi:hypothetical protein